VPDRALDALTSLHAASRALSSATDIEGAIDALIERTIAALDALSAVIVVPGEDGKIELIGSNYPPESTRILDTMTIDDSMPLADAMRSGEGVWGMAE
jgi:hypothetical protein